MAIQLTSFLLKPVYQAAIGLVLTGIIFFILRPEKADTLWIMAGIIYLIFITSNAIAIWLVESAWTYFFFSLLISLAYLFVAGLMVTGYSSLFRVAGSGESGMIFLVIIYHPLALLLVMVLKWVYFKVF